MSCGQPSSLRQRSSIFINIEELLPKRRDILSTIRTHGSGSYCSGKEVGRDDCLDEVIKNLKGKVLIVDDISEEEIISALKTVDFSTYEDKAKSIKSLLERKARG